MARHGMVPFWDGYWGCMVITNGLLVLLSWITCVAVSFNRLSIIPLVISLTGVVANFLAWVAWDDSLSRPILWFVRIVAHSGWHVQEVIAIFYSYFLLQRVLPSCEDKGIFRRRVFMIGYWVLTVGNVCCRIATLGMYIKSWGMDAGPAADNFWIRIEHMTMAYFALTAATEVLTGAFLIRLFHSALRTSEMYCGGQKVGLFKQMALSTEIRVGSLAIIGITRAACSRARNLNEVAYGFDTIMWTLENIYAAVLIVDLLMAKMAGIYVKVDKTTKTVLNNNCQCGQLNQALMAPPCPPLKPIHNYDSIPIDSLGSTIEQKDTKNTSLSASSSGHEPVKISSVEIQGPTSHVISEKCAV